MKTSSFLTVLTALAALGCKPGADLSGSRQRESLYYQNIFGLTQTADGGYLIGVTRYHSRQVVTTTNNLLTPNDQYDPGSTFEDMALIKTDGAGKRQWERVLEKAGSQIGSQLVVMPTGSYLLVGNVFSRPGTTYTAANQEVAVAEVGADGQERSFQTLQKPDIGLFAYDARLTTQGNLLVAGRSIRTNLASVAVAWVARVNIGSSLATWHRLAPDSTSFSQAVTLDAAPDGGSFVAGYGTASGSQSRRTYFQKLSAEGQVIWTRYPDETTHSLTPRRLFATADGGFIIQGWRTDRSTNRDDIFLLKADAEGRVQPINTYDTGGYSNAGQQGMLSRGANGQFLLATWKSTNLNTTLTLTQLSPNGDSPKVITTDGSLINSLQVTYFTRLRDGSCLQAAPSGSGLAKTEVTLLRVGPDGKENGGLW